MNLFLVLLYTLTILYAFMPIKTKHKKSVKYFWFWCAVLLCILTITSDFYADLYNYENYYDDVNIKKWPINYRAMPIGWGVLCKFFGMFNMTYRGMFCCLLLLSMFLLHEFVKKLDCNEKIFWGFYIIFPGLIQAVQLRFFLGSSIAVYALGFLMKENKNLKEQRKNMLFFMIGIILSFFIHSSCIFLSVLLFVVYFRNLNIPKIFGILFLGSVVLTVLIPLIPKILTIFIHSFYIERYFTASTSKTTIKRFIKICLVWFANVGLAYLSISSSSKIKTNNVLAISKSRRVVSRCFAGICILAISIPLLYFDENFHRYFEIGFMFLYIIFAELSILENKEKKYNRRILLTFILVTLIYCIYVYYPLESIVGPLFTYDGFHALFR